MHKAARSASTPHGIDNTDWLKIIAIVAASVGHIGYFFLEDDQWWSVFGRLAAPTLFFFMGYAQTRTVPLHWIWLGFILTLLESWNAGWTWVAANILFSFALIRIARPHVQFLLQHYGWATFALLVSALFATAADSFADCRLRHGGMAVGFIWIAAPHVCRRQINTGRALYSPKLGAACARFAEARGTNAPAGLRHRRGCICLAGTEGIRVFSPSVGRRHSRRRLFVHLLVFVPAGPKPCTTVRRDCRCPALH